MRTAEEILRSLLADIDAMAVAAPEELIQDVPDIEPRAWFGGFGMHFIDEELGPVIEWPNLRALADEARAALRGIG